MSDGEPTKTWTSVIPEFYYDLISRIPPGIFLTICIIHEWFAYTGDEFADYKHVSGGIAAILAALLIGAGYALGIFLSVPAILPAKLYTRRVWRKMINDENDLFIKLKKQEGFESFDFNKPSEIKEPAARKLHRAVHDYLKRKDSHAMVELPKLTAESALCNNSAIALLLYMIIHAFNSCTEIGAKEYSFYLVGSLVVVALVVMAWAKYRRAIESHISYLRSMSENPYRGWNIRRRPDRRSGPRWVS